MTTRKQAPSEEVSGWCCTLQSHASVVSFLWQASFLQSWFNCELTSRVNPWIKLVSYKPITSHAGPKTFNTWDFQEDTSYPNQFRKYCEPIYRWGGSSQSCEKFPKIPHTQTLAWLTSKTTCSPYCVNWKCGGRSEYSKHITMMHQS